MIERLNEINLEIERVKNLDSHNSIDLLDLYVEREMLVDKINELNNQED